MESLIRAGALDRLNKNRAAHLGIYESLMESAQSNAKHNIEGQISLFQINAAAMEETKSMNRLPDVKNFDKEELISMEKEMLGVYITGHPLKEYEEQIKRLVSVNAQDLAEVLDSEEQGGSHSFVRDGMQAIMAGIITYKKNLITKNNKMMAFANLEDLYGTVEVVVFPNVYEKFGNLVSEDSIVSISGSINFKEGEMPKLLAERIVDLRELKEINEQDGNSKKEATGKRTDEVSASEPKGIIKIKLPDNTEIGEKKMLEKIKAVMVKYRGGYQAIVYMPGGGSFRTNENLWVNPEAGFRNEIIDIVGEGNYKG